VPAPLWFRPLYQCLSLIAIHGLSTKKVVRSLVRNSDVTCFFGAPASLQTLWPGEELGLFFVTFFLRSAQALDLQCTNNVTVVYYPSTFFACSFLNVHKLQLPLHTLVRDRETSDTGAFIQRMSPLEERNQGAMAEGSARNGMEECSMEAYFGIIR
jgi:hypothetical protein